MIIFIFFINNMKQFSDTYFVNKNFKKIYELLMEDFNILPSILNILEYQNLIILIQILIYLHHLWEYLVIII